MAIAKSLSSRLRLGIGGIALAFTLSGLVSVFGIISSAREVTRVVDANGPTIRALDRMESSILKQELIASAYDGSDRAQALATINVERSNFETAKTSISWLQLRSKNSEAIVFSDYEHFTYLVDNLIASLDSLRKLQDTKASDKLAGGAVTAILDSKAKLARSRSELLDDFDRIIRKPVQEGLTSARVQATKAAWQSLVVLGILTLAAIAVGALVGTMLMREIRRPVSLLVEGMDRIAMGDREARLESPVAREFEELQSGFNDMAERLDEAEQGLVRSYEGQRKLLDAIPTGFLSISSDYRIEPEYSKATEEILGRTGLAGLPLSEAVFPDSKDQGSRAGLDRYLRQLFENRTADKEFLDEINPVSELGFMREGKERSISVAFERIISGQDISGVLVIIEDRSAIKAATEALEEERRAHKREADSIQAILSIGPGPLYGFFSEARELLAQIRDSVENLKEPSVINACFRYMHSIKGAAGSYGIDAVASTAHEAEDIFARLREGGQQPNARDLVQISILLGRIGEELDGFEALVQRLKASLSRLGEDQDQQLDRNPLHEFADSLASMVGQLERNLAKRLRFEAEIEVEDLPHLREMKQVIIHLIRNAADHGVEDEYERLFQGKDKQGRIKLKIGRKEGSGDFLVSVEDDGQGLNFERIAEKGCERGLIAKAGTAPSRNQLIALLFQPGFSTKEKVDEISGRGVGLDLVGELVRSLGGKIAVASTRGRGTRFTVSIPG